MKAWRVYLLVVGIPVVGILMILRSAPIRPVAVARPAASAAAVPAAGHMPNVPTLLLQIGVILLATRIVGRLFRRIGQPQVVGEMAAGILLGPSLLGWLAPGASSVLFPEASIGFLSSLCQVGLVLFMFLVGVELDLDLLRGRGHVAVVTSHASILAPFFLGTLLALHLYPRLAAPGVAFASFALFVGAAMSVTAFPVLARILAERDLQRTPIGAITLACAAVDDATAWCILAVVVAVARVGGRSVPPLRTLAGSIVFVLVLSTIGRRALRHFGRQFARRRELSRDALAMILLVLIAAAWTAEWIGIHALFGAFMAGAVMPREPGFGRALTRSLEEVSVVLLLPLFFAFTGLRTSVRLLSGAGLWVSALLVLLVAIGGKLGGSAIAARACGLSWREATSVGILMNTRGLMELVILNVGIEIGVLSPELFTIMVLMALVTTFMTSPLLAWIAPGHAEEASIPEAEGAGEPI